MLSIPEGVTVYVHRGWTDMRSGFDDKEKDAKTPAERFEMRPGAFFQHYSLAGFRAEVGTCMLVHKM